MHRVVSPAPRILGRYALHGEIAAGGQAAVHLGRQLGAVGFARTVAIKRLHPQYAKDPSFVAMFLDEARLAARIRHPNVVPTLDVVSLDDELFLVMEYVHGESLARLSRHARARDERIPIEVAVGVASHALHGLHAAHEARSERGTPLEIVHRDVSPQNVLVGVDGVGRVLDFGIAKATSRLQVTAEGQLKGKLAYMAPEQLESHDVDRRVDVWAASIVLWEMLTGRRLFTGDHPGRLMKAVLSAPIPRPSEIADDVPPEVEAVVMRGLERDPDARFATAREMAVALEATGWVATQHAIGAWVERVAAASLAERADRIAEIEGTTDAGVPSTQETPRVVGPDPDRTQIDAGTFAATHAELVGRPRGRRRALVAAIVTASAGALALSVGLIATRSAPDPAATKPAATPAFEPAAVAPSAVGSGAASTSAAASAPPAPAPSSEPAVVGKSVAPKATTKPTSKPTKPSAPAGKPTPSKACDPPYIVDKDGVKIPKLQCL